MAQATWNPTTKLWTRFRDPYLRACFKAAEDDGTAPAFVETDHSPALDGGAVASLELVEA
jgi:hypothetical protein